MNLSNPCSITELITYAETAPFKDDNEYITKICAELNRVSEKMMTQRIVASIFQLFLYSVGPAEYIDIGCAVLSFMAQPVACHDNVFIDIKTGKIGVIEGILPENSNVTDLCNNLKQIIAEIYCPKSEREEH